MWNLYNNTEFLEPLSFSNGKSQKEVVKETLNAIKKGNKIIFIHGICGTGKSAIALNIARKLGKTSIVVPGKTLQNQYKRDYEGGKYVLKENKEKLKISVITGRNNHKCKYLEDNQNAIPKIKREVNAKLHDIFEGKIEEAKELAQNNLSADNPNIPCKLKIQEKNWNKIKKYLKQNKHVDIADFLDIKDVKRPSIAGACPYWCPVLPEKYEIKNNKFSKNKRRYLGLNNTNFVFHKRVPGCGFYEQFNSFIDSDVIVFNSLKYKLESALNRKPSTEVEIIDECDEFLDSFANKGSINLDQLQSSLIHLIGINNQLDKLINELGEIIKQMKKNKNVKRATESKEIIPLKATGIYDILKILLESERHLQVIDDENYLLQIQEIAYIFENFFNESYVIFNKVDNQIIASVITTNLAKKFKEMVEKNKRVILMSGTLHSNNVLKNIFGLEEYTIIDAETQQQGNIEIKKTGLEKNWKYSNLSDKEFSREEYLKSLSRCVEIAEKPTLIHVNAFADLPLEKEIKKLKLNNLMSQERLKELQREDKNGKWIERFKKGDIDILFSTKCARGIDFPGEECNSIIFTKYPNPNVKDAFWRVLMKTHPQYYWDFYKDKAKRELLQKIYRGLRFKEDKVQLLSPDIRVLEAFEE